MLLTHMDNVPLAVVLLARQVQVHDSLESVWELWNEKQIQLRQISSDTGQASLDGSIDLSITSPRMTDPARRLLYLLAVLPDGIAFSDLRVLLG